MIVKAYFTENPKIMNYMPLPIIDKADVWLRKNITTTKDLETGETMYMADEVYFRTSATKETIENDFETWYEKGRGE